MAPAATVFRHRARADSQRKQYKQPDLSHIEDPLLSQAGCYVPIEPAVSRPCSPTDSQHSMELPEGKTHSPQLRTATPPLVFDSETEEESMSDEDDIELLQRQNAGNAIQQTTTISVAG